MKNERAKCNNQNFEVDLSPHITSISPITCRFPPTDSGDGRNWQYKVFQPGQPEYGNITFTGAEHKDSIGNIKSWVKETYLGNDCRKDISINVFDQAKGTVRTFNLFDCMPLHFNIINVESGRTEVIHWTLEVRVNRWEAA
jgi:phage tail-like protein